MLAERIALRMGTTARPEFRWLLAEWGDRPGGAVGAACYRFWTPERHSEIAMAVTRPWRSLGIGRALLEELTACAKGTDVRALSLSVDPNDPAITLYERAGFREVGASGTSVTMLLDL